MWMIPLLSLLLYILRVCATQTNHTIDDADPLVTYRGTIDRSLTGFDPTRLNDGTVTFIPAPATDDSSAISINFTGTAVYVFIAYPAGRNDSLGSGFTARIDGGPNGVWAVSRPTAMYNHLAYQNTVLANAPHNLVLHGHTEWELYFDYVIYTSDQSDLASPPPPLLVPSANAPTPTNLGSPGSSPSSPGASTPIANLVSPTGGSSSTSSPDTSTSASPVSPSMISSPDASTVTKLATPSVITSPGASTSNTTRPFPVGAVAGGAVGGLILLALLAIPFIFRRRALAKLKAKPFATPSPASQDFAPSAPPLSAYPFLQQAQAARPGAGEKSGLRVGIPRAGGYLDWPESPYSTASDPTLLSMAEEIRCIRSSVQRLQTELPEARDGSPVFQRPPPYAELQSQSL
ncbi:hypothetical protein GGX14DRAFT_667054 [Mycena pura]|uniref:Uncharacterized protein n=1 Tax=Mycena pura TaxID=153505 RepID=A0AAD6V263_9AGAR|nr:hypothetical protein GGX14DRAFT_667054 [Mycena pura]